MKKIKYIIVHCTATAEGKNFTKADVDRWHKQRGWKMIGYHYLIRLDGTIEQGRPLYMTGAHCKGHNAESIGVCYVGGLASDGKTPKDTRTPQQKAALKRWLGYLKRTYPDAQIVGHCDLDAKKACPCFDAKIYDF